MLSPSLRWSAALYFVRSSVSHLAAATALGSVASVNCLPSAERTSPPNERASAAKS